MEQFMGMIAAFGFRFAPQDWSLCKGDILKIDGNNALYSLLRDRYGGDGSSTFGLPDLVSRAPVGDGMSRSFGTIYQIGAKGGAQNLTLSADQLPAHSHMPIFEGTYINDPFEATLDVKFGLGQATTPADGFTLSTPSQESAPSTFVPGDSLYIPPDSNQTIVPLSGLETTGNSAVATDVKITIAETGDGQSMPIQDPFLAINYCIAVDGLYPPRW